MAVRTNLVQNPKFQNNANFWALDADFTANIGSGGAISGGYVAQSSTGGFANFTTVNDSNGYPVDTNTDYVFSFYYKISAQSGNGPIARVRGSGAFGTDLGVIFIGNTGGNWVRGEIAFNSGEHTLVYFALSNNGGNITAEYSNFMLEEDPLATEEAGDYFDGDNTDTEFYQYDWVGTANASSSTETELFDTFTETFTVDGLVEGSFSKDFTVDGVVLVQGVTETFTIGGIVSLGEGIRKNLVPNPKFETNTIGYALDADFTLNAGSGGAISGGYVEQVSAGGFANFTTTNDDGSAYPVEPGEDYIFSFYYKTTSFSGSGPIAAINHTSAFGSALDLAFLGDTGGSWQRIELEFNADVYDKVWLKISNNNGNVTAQYSNFMLEKTATLGDWFDGDSIQDGYLYAWDEDADNSQSSEIRLFEINTQTFTVDGVVRSRGEETITADGIVRGAGLTYKGIDIMAWTKDLLRNPVAQSRIDALCEGLARDFDLTHIGISVLMNTQAEATAEGVSPFSLEPAAYALQFANAIHAQGKRVLWRPTDCYFEGLYDFPKWVGDDRYPVGDPQDVIDNVDRANWLGRVYNYIVNNPQMFESGDLWGPFPESTGHGIFNDSTSFLPNTGPGLQANFLAFHQGLIEVSKAAFTVIGKDVRCGFSAQNWSEIDSGWIPSTLHDDQGTGRLNFDHYGTNGADYSPEEMAADLDDTYSTYGLPMFHQEWGDYWSTDPGYGYNRTQEEHEAYLRSMYAVFQDKVNEGKLFGFNYWRAIGAHEAIYTNDGDETDPEQWHPTYEGYILQEFFAANTVQDDPTYEGDYTGAEDYISFLINGVVKANQTGTFTVDARIVNPEDVVGGGWLPDDVESLTGGATTISRQYTIGSGNNRLMVVSISCQDSNHFNLPVVSMVYAGRPLTKAVHREPSGNVRAEIWYLINPPVGTATITISTVGPVWKGAIISSWFGANQEAQPHIVAANHGTSDESEVSLITTEANCLVIDAISSESQRLSFVSGLDITPLGREQAQDFENISAAYNLAESAGTVTFGANFGHNDRPWAHVLVAFSPAPPPLEFEPFYILNGTNLPRPKRFKRAFVFIKGDTMTLGGRTGRDILHRKEKFVLGWEMLEKREVALFQEIVDLNIPVTFKIVHQDLSVTERTVIPYISAINYDIPGSSYIARLDLELIDEA